MPTVAQELKAVGLMMLSFFAACLCWFSLFLLAAWPLSSLGDWWPAVGILGGFLGFIGLLLWVCFFDGGFAASDRALDRYMAWVDHVAGVRRIPDYVPLRKRRLARALGHRAIKVAAKVTSRVAASWVAFRYGPGPLPKDRFLSARRRQRADRLIVAAAIQLEETAAADYARQLRERAALPERLLAERLDALFKNGFLEVVDSASVHVTLAAREWLGLPLTAPPPRRTRPSAFV